MNDGSDRAIGKLCADLAARVAQDWSWDSHFGTALLTYKQPEDEHIKQATSAVLDSVWTDTTAGSAPEPIKKLVSGLGGLRPGQSLMTSTAVDDTVLFGVFWPWGNGSTISLRVGCAVDGANSDAVMQALRTAFGV